MLPLECILTSSLIQILERSDTNEINAIPAGVIKALFGDKNVVSPRLVKISWSSKQYSLPCLKL